MTQSEDTIFVGREEELTQLMAFAKDAFADKAGVAFVTGEAGIGKTFLVEEFFRQLQKEYEDVVIASGQCTIQSASYLPLRSLLENLLTSQKEVMAETIGKVGVELLGVFGISGKTVQKPSDGDTARLIQQRDELQHQWDLLSKQLTLLEEERILETRPEEKFRLEHKIDKIKVEREQIGSALNDLERQSPRQTRIDLSETTIPKDLAPMQVFGWYTKVMQDVSSFFPLVLFIDDLHWADDSSLNLLFHLGRELKGQRMLVIGTYRPHEVTQNSLLMKVKAELGRYGAKEFCLDLSESKPEDAEKTKHFVHEYLMTKYGTHFSDTVEQVLVNRTEGNALFLTEILKNLEEKGQIAQKVDTTSKVEPTSAQWQLTKEIKTIKDLPEKVENAISERVNRLEATLREILDYASVEGDDFIAQVIARVRRIQERSLISDLTKKLMKTYQLIWERGGKSLPNGYRIHEFSFKHNLIREYVYAQLSETDKEFIHAEIGECLERLYEPNTDEIASQLAVHFFHGQVLGKAMYYCLKAAEDANQRYGVSEAVRFGKMGLEALEQQANILLQREYAENKIRLLLELAKAEEFGGNPQEDKDHIQAGISYLEDDFSLLDFVTDELCAEIYAQLGKLFNRKGSDKKQKAEEFLKKALSIYEKANNKKNIAEIFYLLGGVYPYIPTENGQSPDDKAIEVVERSLSIAKQLQDVELQSKCLSSLKSKYGKKDFSYAERCAIQALQLSKSLGKTDKQAKIKALIAVAQVCRGKAKYKTAIQHLERCLELFRGMGDLYLEAWVLNDIAFDFIRYVNLQEEAQTRLKKSLLIRERIGYVKVAPFTNLGTSFTIQGRLKRAEEYYRMVLAISTERGQSLRRDYIGLLYMLQGNYVQAEKEFLLSLKILEKYQLSQTLLGYTRIALNYILLGDKIQCKKYMEVTQSLFEKETYPRIKWQYLYESAEVYRILGELEFAKTICQQSIDWFLTNADDAEKLVFVSEARLIMGKILVDMEEYQEAISYLNKAKTAFEICGHYALGDALLYLGKAHQGLGKPQAQEYVNNALTEFQRLELHQKEHEAREILEKLI